MLVLTPKYGSLIDIDLLKNKKKYPLIKHRLNIDLNNCKTIKKAYLTFLSNKDKYIIGFKPNNAKIINRFVKSLGEIETLDVSWIDVSKLDSLYECFRNCKVKHIIGLEKWDVSNVKDMWGMFSECGELESVGDISEWNVSNVKKLNGLFNSCKKLESIGDISGWDVSNVEDMGGMFVECKKLESIGDISGWDVRKAAWIVYMFDGCEKLESVGDIERWKLPANTFTRGMFVNSAIKPIPSWYHE